MTSHPGQYLYCIVECSQERTFGGVAPVGGGEMPVYAVPWNGLAAVVSDSATKEYDITRANMLATSGSRRG